MKYEGRALIIDCRPTTADRRKSATHTKTGFFEKNPASVKYEVRRKSVRVSFVLRTSYFGMTNDKHALNSSFVIRH